MTEAAVAILGDAVRAEPLEFPVGARLAFDGGECTGAKSFTRFKTIFSVVRFDVCQINSVTSVPVGTLMTPAT